MKNNTLQISKFNIIKNIEYSKNKHSLFLVYPLFIIRIKQEIINSKNKQSLFLVYSNFILCLFLVYFKNKQRINKDFNLIRMPLLSNLKALLKNKNKNIIYYISKFIEFIKTFSFFIDSIEFIHDSKKVLKCLYMGTRNKLHELPFLGFFLSLLSPYKAERVKKNEFQ